MFEKCARKTENNLKRNKQTNKQKQPFFFERQIIPKKDEDVLNETENGTHLLISILKPARKEKKTNRKTKDNDND